MNPLLPNAFELIMFYVVPVLIVTALAFVITLVARGRRSSTVDFIAEDRMDESAN